MPGESDFIEWIRSRQSGLPHLEVGIGDDLAATRWKDGALLLAGVDQILDGVHFDSQIHLPRLIGQKAMNRNLSDCAAMGCEPVFALASVALPRGCGIEFARELFLGASEAGEKFGCSIIGGDTGSWDGELAISISIIGRCDGWKPVTRAGARVGDTIFVTGALGGSILGRHMTFEPRVEIGIELARSGVVTSMIDLSDGLSRDLPRICLASGVGAVIEANRVPVHPDAHELSKRDSTPPLEHALHDGEDYELLFTAGPGAFDDRFARIGRIIAGADVSIDDNGSARPLLPLGWEHPL